MKSLKDQIGGTHYSKLAIQPVEYIHANDIPFIEGSIIKYATNSFFCTKVSFFNELAQVCKAHGLNPETVIGKVLLDQRIGRSHFQVPGHDGRLGFGGSCFPKDINGYIQIAKDAGVEPTVAEAVWKKNLEVRPEEDWKELKGRAVSDESQEP